jgi:hypothetical protein
MYKKLSTVNFKIFIIFQRQLLLWFLNLISKKDLVIYLFHVVLVLQSYLHMNFQYSNI